MKTTAVLLLCIAALGLRAAETPVFKLVRTILLPGVKGHLDHFAIDANGRRLFVASLGNNTLEVVDTAAGKRLKSILGLSKPADVLYLAEQNQIAVANGDEGTFERIARFPARTGARTSFFSSDSEQLFLAVPSHDGQVAEIRIFSAGSN